MATQRRPILGFATIADNSGDVRLEPISAFFDTVSPLYDPLIWTFLDAANAERFLYGSFDVPEDYVGTPEIEMIWSTIPTTGTMDFDFGYRVTDGDTTESFDITTDGQRVNITDAAAGTARRRQVATFTGLTAANFHKNATVFFRLSRDSAVAGDIVNSIWLFGLRFKYSDV